jgi:hypothetical protein
VGFDEPRPQLAAVAPIGLREGAHEDARSPARRRLTLRGACRDVEPEVEPADRHRADEVVWKGEPLRAKSRLVGRERLRSALALEREVLPQALVELALHVRHRHVEPRPVG